MLAQLLLLKRHVSGLCSRPLYVCGEVVCVNVFPDALEIHSISMRVGMTKKRFKARETQKIKY